MTNPEKSNDVFIAHSATDVPLASELAKACRANGLEAATHGELSSGPEASDALWDALAESQAVVIVLSPTGVTSDMGVEIGAAQAWNKPIFAVVTDPSLTRLPVFLSDIKFYPPGRIGDVIDAIKLSGQHFTDEERALLAEAYRGIGVPVDALIQEAKKLQKLVKRFRIRTSKNVTGEQVVSELLRMRKKGLLNWTAPLFKMGK